MENVFVFATFCGPGPFQISNPLPQAKSIHPTVTGMTKRKKQARKKASNIEPESEEEPREEEPRKKAKKNDEKKTSRGKEDTPTKKKNKKDDTPTKPKKNEAPQGPTKTRVARSRPVESSSGGSEEDAPSRDRADGADDDDDDDEPPKKKEKKPKHNWIADHDEEVQKEVHERWDVPAYWGTRNRTKGTEAEKE